MAGMDVEDDRLFAGRVELVVSFFARMEVEDARPFAGKVEEVF